MQNPRLFLIDAHALCYRAFYAIKGLMTSTGQPTNAVYGFVNTLRKIWNQYQPDYCAICFDSPAQTQREKKYNRYKIQRPVMPDGLISQMPLIKRVVSAYRLPVFELDGYEADDLIATIVESLRTAEVGIVIVSDDKDIYQLVNPKVGVYHSRRDQILTHEQIGELLGMDPLKIPDFIALAGDSTDNIPGVKGVGQVTAKKLIAQFGNLENLYQHLSQVKPVHLQKKLNQQRAEAFLSKELALLAKQVPVAVDLQQMQRGQPDREMLLQIYNELEFRRWAEELAGQFTDHAGPAVQKIDTKEEWDAVSEDIHRQGKLYFLIAHGADAQSVPATGRVFFTTGTEQIYVTALSEQSPLRAVMESPAVTKVTHNVKTALKLFARFHWAVCGGWFDLMLGAYLLAPVKDTADLGSLAWQYLKTPLSGEELEHRGIGLLPALHGKLDAGLREKGLSDLFESIEMPLTFVLARMEVEGVCLDVPFLDQLAKECASQIQNLQKELYALAGQDFNLNSPKQLSGVLFEKLKLPVMKRTKTGFSTDEEVLRQLAQKHPLPAKILEYRQLAKLKSTYIDALPKMVDTDTRRVHASFNQAGTETGRLSSSNPNLQNIPIRTELGREIRKAFIPSDTNRRILSADYSQIELRILSHLSEDENLQRAFHQGQDIHRFTAALVYDIPQEDVTHTMRYAAKRVNFGIIYGMSSYGLAKDLGIPAAQAQEFIDKYFTRYPGVKRFMERTVRECEQNGYVTTLLKRRRYIPEIKSSNIAVRQFAQRQAINTPVQGSAADLIKLAMIRIQKEIDAQFRSAKMIITVHDELVFDVPAADLESFAEALRHIMEHCLELSVPIRVTLKQGQNWLQAEEMAPIQS